MRHIKPAAIKYFNNNGHTISGSYLWTISAAKTISTGAHSTSSRYERKIRIALIQLICRSTAARNARWKYNIVKVLCVFFPRPAEGEGRQNAMIYFGRRAWDSRGEGWKQSKKLTRTAYHCCRRVEGIRLPLSHYALAADSSRFVYYIIINFPVEQTSSNGLFLSLFPSLFLSVSVSFALRSRT